MLPKNDEAKLKVLKTLDEGRVYTPTEVVALLRLTSDPELIEVVIAESLLAGEKFDAASITALSEHVDSVVVEGMIDFMEGEFSYDQIMTMSKVNVRLCKRDLFARVLAHSSCPADQKRLLMRAYAMGGGDYDAAMASGEAARKRFEVVQDNLEARKRVLTDIVLEGDAFHHFKR